MISNINLISFTVEYLILSIDLSSYLVWSLAFVFIYIEKIICFDEYRKICFHSFFLRKLLNFLT
jgi:hypothetical protein